MPKRRSFASRKRFASRRRVIIATASAAAALLIGKKAYDYGAAPSGPKACAFAFPDPAGEEIGEATDSSLGLSQRAGFIDDASCLNRTAVAGIATIRSEDDLAAALRLARQRGWKVSAAGCRHSMGGQAFGRGNLVLDMREFNRIEIDKPRRVMKVQAGAIWTDVQSRLDREALAVIAMQSYSGFTVGGSLSVNAHGVAHRPGVLAATVRSIRVMLGDGDIVVVGPAENADLFRHVIGGYGLFGVILDAELDVTDNAFYRREITYADYRSIPGIYAEIERLGDAVALMYGRFSVDSADYLQTIDLHRFMRLAEPLAPTPLPPESYTGLKRFTLNVSKTGRLGRWLRWELERNLEPRLETCVTRSEALSEPEACLVTRNQEMFDSGGYLENRLTSTDILQEYFVPPSAGPRFIDGLRDIVAKTEVNLLNVTLRMVPADRTTALPYAPADRVGFVLYFNQALERVPSETLWRATQQLIDLALDCGGRFYLPYQLAYSREQLLHSYPEIPAFFATKRRYDPTGLFSNKLFEKYGAAFG
jgi:FAD/FMN-containing dehydrogenase